MKNKFLYVSVLVALGFAACEPEFENDVDANYSAGDADFTTFVAVGNSLTAGYMDGTVYRDGQANSFPNMLAEQFSLVGGGAFTQPSFDDDVNNLGGLTLGGTTLAGTRLVIDASEGRPENIAGSPSIDIANISAGARNNMGVPGAKSFHLLAPGYGNIAGVSAGLANPYYVRFASSPNASVLGDAMSLNPTFFTCWIGANDILSYATSGGANADGMTPAADHNSTGNLDPTTYGSNDITNANVFAATYNLIINGGTHPLLGSVTGLTSNGAKGVVATIPSVTSIPYFTTVPYNPVPDALLNADQANAALLTQLYQFLFVATGGRISPLQLNDGANNSLLIYDADLSDLGAQITAYASASGNPLLMAYAAQLGALYGKARSCTNNDLVVLTASSVIGTENPAVTAPFNIQGVTLPLANKYVLTSTEKTRVLNATTAYNNAIVSIAASKDLAVADMNSIMNQLVSGLRIDTGQLYTADYFSGVASEHQVLFSLDGVHPNSRGYAVIANAFLNVINSHYNANIPLKFVNDYRGVQIVGSN
ncbi:G-D-S-L family lipolytic protein [Flavobacterium sp.]|uniref:G-D-S-L family lipolytic protein n=1 Tax=Flavobacterium sp. TaxID=239 RepID=UPI0035272B9D